MGKKELDDATRWYVRERILHWPAEHGGELHSEFARASGVSKPTISDLVRGTREVGYQTAHAYAGVRKITFEALKLEAAEAYRQHRASAPPAPAADRYPNRAAAITFLRDEFPAEILVAVAAATGLPFTGDPPRWWWVDRVRAEANLRGFQPALPQLAPVRDDGALVAKMINNSGRQSPPAAADAQSSRGKRVGS